MDLYADIIYNSDLYKEEVIRNIALNTPEWANGSSRQRELLLRKITTCLLLSNTETYVPLGEKRKMSKKAEVEGPKKKKGDDSTRRKFAFEEKKHEIGAEPKPSTSSALVHVPGDGDSIDTCETSNSGSTEPETDGMRDEEPLRIELISVHPSPTLKTSLLADKWKVQKPKGIYDLGDNKERKFINVVIGGHLEEVLKEHQRKTMGETGIASLAYCMQRDGQIIWINHPGGLRGESKVKAFLLKRTLELQNRGIMESLLLDSRDLEDKIFSSPTFNAQMNMWIHDWISTTNDVWDKEKLYKNGVKSIDTVRPDVLLSLLSDLQEPERVNYIKWRGKIIPDPICHSFETSEEKDSQIVDTMITIMKDDIDTEALNVDLQSNFCGETFLKLLISKWETSERSTFEFIREIKSDEDSWIYKTLGYSHKGVVHNEEFTGGKQKDRKIMQKYKYHGWFSYLLRCLNTENVNGENKYHYYENLLENSIEDGHPIVTVSNRVTRELWDYLLASNTAAYSSRLTGLYSRLGGSYGQAGMKSKNARDTVSIIPIYANAVLRSEEGNKMVRRVSGLCLRGPTHARNPTDRIGLVTIEAISKSDRKNIEFANHIYKAKKIVGKNYLWVIKQNSIMREDTSYVTFNINSLFTPTNLYGISLLEDMKCPSNLNVLERHYDILKNEKKWFLERFTEGIVMSAIGTSRDEGYFAHLRKMFLILFSWKNDEHVASWDIETFCRKTNECLIDNPLSMNFHLTIRELLKQYL